MSDLYTADPIKAKARHEIYKAAYKYLPKEIGNGSALVLPSTNSLETRMLEQRGFRRERMIALEGDPEKVDAVRQANPGILVVPMTTHEFFGGKWQGYREFFPLTYCGLDYECQLNQKVMKDLVHVAENQLLIHGGMIYTNVSGMRENEEMKLNYSHCLIFSNKFKSEVLQNPLYRQLSEEVETRIKENKDCQKLRERIRSEGIDGEKSRDEYHALKQKIREEVFEPHEEKINKVFSQFSEKHLKVSRDKAISGWVRIHLETRDFEKFKVAEIKFDDFIAEVYGRHFYHNNGELPMSDIERKLGFCGHPKLLRLFYSDLIEISKQIEERDLNEERQGYGIGRFDINKFSRDYFKKAGLDEFLKLLDSVWIGGYSELESCRFQYISNKNTNMMLDILKVSELSSFIEQKLQTVLSSDWTLFYGISRPYLIRKSKIPNENFNKCPEIDLLKKETSKFKKWLSGELGDRLNKHWKHVMEYESTEHSRVHLGSSYRPILRKESIARKLVIEGKSNDEIAQQYIVGKEMQKTINALRACKTQGTLKILEEEKLSSKKFKQKNVKTQYESPKEFTYFLKPKIYNRLPRTHQKALQYFVDETVVSLSKKKQENIREAFLASDFEDNIRRPIEDIRLYAFFDDLRADIMKNRPITAETINAHYQSVRDAQSLIEVVTYQPKKAIKEKPKKKQSLSLQPLPEPIKEEIRQLRREGFEVEDMYHYLIGKGISTTIPQVSAIASWVHPNLAKKKQEASP